MDAVEGAFQRMAAGCQAIVVDGDEFLGLITRIDLLNWLRQKV